jgi:hypothetical protein
MDSHKHQVALAALIVQMRVEEQQIRAALQRSGLEPTDIFYDEQGAPGRYYLTLRGANLMTSDNRLDGLVVTGLVDPILALLEHIVPYEADPAVVGE